MEEMRLQKFLSSAGIASRRKCEEFILEGKIKVNGQVVCELGTKIDPSKDEVKYNDKKVELVKEEHTYILLNKPIGYVTTANDQFGRDTVLDLLKKVNRRLVPVGRLDMFTSGALILTDDGDFVYKVTHPKHEITKTYTVTVRGIVEESEVQKLREGVIIDNDYTTKPADARIIKIDREKNQSRMEIRIHEGKNRQVRKMCEAIGRKVLALHRTKIGDVGVKDLKIGTWRYLTPNEIKSILKNN